MSRLCPFVPHRGGERHYGLLGTRMGDREVKLWPRAEEAPEHGVDRRCNRGGEPESDA